MGGRSAFSPTLLGKSSFERRGEFIAAFTDKTRKPPQSYRVPFERHPSVNLSGEAHTQSLSMSHSFPGIAPLHFLITSVLKIYVKFYFNKSLVLLEFSPSLPTSSLLLPLA